MDNHLSRLVAASPGGSSNVGNTRSIPQHTIPLLHHPGVDLAGLFPTPGPSQPLQRHGAVVWQNQHHRNQPIAPYLTTTQQAPQGAIFNSMASTTPPKTYVNGNLPMMQPPVNPGSLPYIVPRYSNPLPRTEQQILTTTAPVPTTQRTNVNLPSPLIRQSQVASPVDRFSNFAAQTSQSETSLPPPWRLSDQSTGTATSTEVVRKQDLESQLRNYHMLVNTWRDRLVQHERKMQAIILAQKAEREKENRKYRSLFTECTKAQADAKKYKKEAEEAKDRLLCTICQDAEASMLLMKCGHLCTCQRCTSVLNSKPKPECPICRQPIEFSIRTYRA
ncbi:hypothetical protein FRC02_008708 [Tulasnella sp. 418]|nr:hypothetical protein FRC02_008708 [Tulasnella sp. 418]